MISVQRQLLQTFLTPRIDCNLAGKNLMAVYGTELELFMFYIFYFTMHLTHSVFRLVQKLSNDLTYGENDIIVTKLWCYHIIGIMLQCVT